MGDDSDGGRAGISRPYFRNTQTESLGIGFSSISEINEGVVCITLAAPFFMSLVFFNISLQRLRASEQSDTLHRMQASNCATGRMNLITNEKRSNFNLAFLFPPTLQNLR